MENKLMENKLIALCIDNFFRWLNEYGKNKNITRTKDMGKPISSEMILRGEVPYSNALDIYEKGARQFELRKVLKTTDAYGERMEITFKLMAVVLKK